MNPTWRTPRGRRSGEEDRFGCCDVQKIMCMQMCDIEGLGIPCYEASEQGFLQCLLEGP